MSAVLEPFADDDPESVSAQARPVLAAIEQLCRRFSISTDSGVSTGTLSDGGSTSTITAPGSLGTVVSHAPPPPTTSHSPLSPPVQAPPPPPPPMLLSSLPPSSSASASSSIVSTSDNSPAGPAPFAFAPGPAQPAAPPSMLNLPRPRPRPTRGSSYRRTGSPTASDFGWGSAAGLAVPSQPGPGPGWGPKIMLTRPTGSLSSRRVSSLAPGSFTAPSTPRTSISSRRNPRAPQPFLINLPKDDDQVPPSMMAIAEGAVMLSPGADPDAVSEEEEAWDTVARTLRPVADVLRQPRLRTDVGASEMPQHVLALLRMSTIPRSSKYLAPLQDAQTQLLRVLGNLCVDCDENRDRLLGLQAASAILAVADGFLNDPVPDIPMLVLFDAATLYLLRAATGAIENLELDHSPMQAYLSSNPLALRTLFRLGSSPRIYTSLSWTLGGGYGFVRSGSLQSEEARDLIQTGATIASRAWKILQDVLASPVEPHMSDDELSPGAASLGARFSGSSRGSATAPLPDAVQAARPQVSPELETRTPHQRRTSHSHRSRPSRGGGVEACLAPLHAKALVIDTAINATAVVLRAFLDPRGKPSKTIPATDVPWTSADRKALASADEQILSAAAELIESSSLDSSAWRRAAVAPDSWADAVRYPSGLRNRTPMAVYAAFVSQATPPSSWRLARSDGHMHSVTHSLARRSPRPSSALFRQSAATGILLPPVAASFSEDGAGYGDSDGDADADADADGSWDEDEAFEQCRSALVRSFLAIANEERAIDMLFSPSGTGAPHDGAGSAAWLVDILLQWLAGADESRPELVSVALLALGSLVRTEPHCIALVHKFHLGQRILPIFDRTWARQLVQQSAALMGMMRNLALPNTNKGPLGALGWVDKAAGILLRTSHAPASLPPTAAIAVASSTASVPTEDLLFRTVLLLKNLAQGAAGNSVRVALGPARDALAQVATSTSFARSPWPSPTSLEAGRVLGVVVQTLFLIPLPDAAALETAAHTAAEAEGVRLARTMLAARDAVATPPVVASALAAMVCASPRYPVLVNEGLNALGFIATTLPGAAAVATALIAPPPSSAAHTSQPPAPSSSSSSSSSPPSSSSAAVAAAVAPSFPPRLEADTEAGTGNAGGAARTSPVSAGTGASLSPSSSFSPATNSSPGGCNVGGNRSRGATEPALLQDAHAHTHSRTQTPEAEPEPEHMARSYFPTAAPGIGTPNPAPVAVPVAEEDLSPRARPRALPHTQSVPGPGGPGGRLGSRAAAPVGNHANAQTQHEGQHPPRCEPLEMLIAVLARRDARMPPHYASNACALVIKLFAHASSAQASALAPGQAHAQALHSNLHIIATRIAPALRTLASQGPTEALAVAQRALDYVAPVLSTGPVPVSASPTNTNNSISITSDSKFNPLPPASLMEDPVAMDSRSPSGSPSPLP